MYGKLWEQQVVVQEPKILIFLFDQRWNQVVFIDRTQYSINKPPTSSVIILNSNGNNLTEDNYCKLPTLQRLVASMRETDKNENGWTDWTGWPEFAEQILIAEKQFCLFCLQKRFWIRIRFIWIWNVTLNIFQRPSFMRHIWNYLTSFKNTHSKRIPAV